MTTKKKVEEESEDSEKKAQAAEPEKGKAPKPVLDELVLNHKTGKYSAIPLIAMWAKELRKREDLRHLTPNEILELAMEQVLNGTVGWDDLKKALVSGAAKAATGIEGLTRAKKEK
ncbi:MAG: hypothetical protein HY924_03565 [Elusimicrobia bacterium]|nr:hypothetical protein [Elusimicrobiota bacterium]